MTTPRYTSRRARAIAWIALAGLGLTLIISGWTDAHIATWIAALGYATSIMIGHIFGQDASAGSIARAMNRRIIPEHVAETRKMYATAAITATVLKNGETVGQRKITQRFSGETFVYSVPEHYSIVPLEKTPDLVELVITTHVVTWHDITHPMPGSPELPFRGGTREETP